MKPNYSFSSRRTRRIDPHNKHRKAFPALAREVVRISDVVLYVLDARFIEDTRNKDLERLMRAKDKVVITVLNKSDLVNISKLKKDKELENLEPYVFVSTKTNLGRKRLRDSVKIEIKRLRATKSIISDSISDEDEAPSDALKTHKRVIGKTQLLKITKKAHVGIVGYPNTGKSSLINMLTNTGSVRSSAEAGFTKGIQKVKFSKDILILDTPGVIESNQSSQSARDVKKQTKVGARTYSKVKDPEMVVVELMKDHAPEIESFYGIDSKGDVEILIEKLGRKRRFLLKGGVVDIDKTSRLILKDWQSGKIAESSK